MQTHILYKIVQTDVIKANKKLLVNNNPFLYFVLNACLMYFYLIVSINHQPFGIVLGTHPFNLFVEMWFNISVFPAVTQFYRILFSIFGVL